MKSLTFLILMVSFLIGCDSPVDYSEVSTSNEKIIVDNGIVYLLTIPANVYSLNDSLNISFRVKNISNSVKVFEFANIQQLGFQLIDKSNNISLYYPVIVSPALSSFTLNPNESEELRIISLFKNHSGYYINKGQYILSVFLLDNNSPGLKIEITVN
jgi:hypothetical protein